MKKILLLTPIFFCWLRVAYTQPGKPDASFGMNGIVKTDAGRNYNFGGNAKKVLLEPGGDFYIITPWGPDNSVIIKKHSDGSAAVSFGINGISQLVPMNASSGVIQSDGKIVMVGTNDDKFALARYKMDGNLDPTFGDHGFQNVKTKDFAVANDVAVQPDGKIVVVGEAAYNGSNDGPEAYFATARFNPDGSLDNTFDGDGWQTNYFGSYGAIANTVAIQADGKIVVGGETQYEAHAGLIRYNSDGSRDIDFIGEFDLYTEYLAIKSLIIQPDGKIVVAGYPYYPFDFSVARYNTDGTQDITFPGNGITGGAHSVALQSDGKILAVGYNATGPKSEFVIARWNMDGSPDNNFDSDGKQTLDFGEGDNGANSLAIQSNGKIIAAGYAKISGSNDFAVARFDTDGSLDKSFDHDGLLPGGLIASNTLFTSTVVQSDGKVVAAGRAWNGSNFDFAIGRYNVDGMPDATFGVNGIMISDFNSGDEVANSIKIQGDGKLVVAGSRKIVNGYYSILNSIIVRYNPDGSLDNTFLGNGINLNYSNITSVALQDDGKILIAGINSDYSYYFSISRLNSDGSPDNTFGNNGTTIFFDLYGYYYVLPNSIAIQSDGKIVAVGGGIGSASSGTFFHAIIARCNADGIPDDQFGDFGIKTSSFPAGFANSVALQSDGTMATVVTSRDNSHRNYILQINTDGNLVNYIETGINDSLTSVAIQTDDKILVAGRSQDNFAIARFNKDGTKDLSFSDDGLEVTEFSPGRSGINAIAISGNKLYAAGFDANADNQGIIARYLLEDKGHDHYPIVTITSPSNNSTYPAPGIIPLTASATAKDAKIKSVEFYNGSTLLFIEYNYPYSRKWLDVPLGDYTITAVATDDKGLHTTSAPVHVHVVPDQPPVVSILSPADNATYLAPGIIPLTAVATDPVGKIKSVDFYHGTTLIFTEYNYPYSRKWLDVPAGDYIITAVATDDKGLTTTSAPVHVSVVTPTVGSFTLVDANTNHDLLPLYDGIILDKNTLPENLNIRANTSPKKVGSVVFILDGKVIRTENGFPFALAGDSPTGNYHAWTLPLGEHTLTAIPYAKYNGVGQEGTSLTIHFTVVNNQPITLSKKTLAEKDFSGETLTVKLSPNPAHNILQVNINGQESKQSRLVILSASGGAIKTLENLKSNRVEMDVSQLASGTYFMKIISGEKMVYKRFVKL